MQKRKNNMALESLENMLGKIGYVKIADSLYLYGEITETGASGLSGYYAVLEGLSNNKTIKVGIWAESDLILFDPLIGDRQGQIIGK